MDLAERNRELRARVDELEFRMAEMTALPPVLEGIHFTVAEEAILGALMNNRGRRLSNYALVQSYIWRCPCRDEPDAVAVRVLIHKIRKKLAGTGIVIRNIWGSGYTIDEKP